MWFVDFAGPLKLYSLCRLEVSRDVVKLIIDKVFKVELHSKNAGSLRIIHPRNHRNLLWWWVWGENRVNLLHEYGFRAWEGAIV